MFILTATTEAVPFCKTGGLGDVCGSLPREVARLGHRAAVVLPAFRHALECGQPIEPTGISLEIPIGRKMVVGEVLGAAYPIVTSPSISSRVTAISIDRSSTAKGASTTTTTANGSSSSAVPSWNCCRRIDACPDVIHCNDWPSGLIPAYLRTEYAGLPGYENVASLMTIHNLAFQGNFWHWDMELTGIDWRHFNWREMEFFGNLSFLKSGISMADKVNTVSPRYAKEISLTAS